jgi:phosphopantetheine--protein transferase-like protein
LLVGNDVVDMQDAETRLDALHPRFVERVFTAEERQRISSSDDVHASLWAHWAAKESCFKILKKVDPSTVFAHAAFCVELDEDRRQNLISGSVHNAEHRLSVFVEREPGWVHAVATLSQRSGAFLLKGVSRRPDGAEQSKAVRSFALDRLRRRPGAIGDLEIAGSRPPRLLHKGDPVPIDLSLSHHGRWIAFAASGAKEANPP